MEKLNRKKIFNVIFLLCFLGMVLSLSLYLYMSDSVHSDADGHGQYFGENGNFDGALFGYDSRFMKNEVFHSMIIESEYRMFGNVKQGDVIKGRHGFLFDFGKNQHGYDYAADYFGQQVMTDEALSALGEAIALRQRIFAEQGRHYILAVIPNSQTVYSEYMPRYFSSVSNNTALAGLSRYAKEKGIECFVDLTEFMNASKSSGMLYNNTENSINALGAYFVYSAILNELPTDIVEADRKLEPNDFSYYTHYTDGKNTAVQAGLDGLIKNETVSMSNSTEFKYTVVDHSENLATTYVKSAYKNEVQLKPTVLVDCSSEWDKIQLMPYFSNTFGVSSYRVGHVYDKDTMTEVNPLVVIQTIHECELPYLLDYEVNRSYRNALDQEMIPYKTGIPKQVEFTVLDGNSACISGIAENDVEVRVFGEGFDTVSVKPIDGRFFVKITFEDSVQNKEVFLDAKAEDKAASDHISLMLSGINNVGSARTVEIGSGSMLYKADYEVPAELPSNEMLNEYRVRLFNSFSGIREVSGNFELEMILATVPQKISVYKEGLPTVLENQRLRLEENKEVFSQILNRANVEYLDLSRVLSENSKNEKMFFQTTDELTDMAYYYMYYEIISQLSQASPQYSEIFTPIKAERFMEYSSPVSDGFLAGALGFDPESVTERVTKLRFTGNSHSVKNPDGSVRYYGTDDELPNAVIVYDTDCEPLIGLLAEHFGNTYVMKHDNAIPANILVSMKPDFIIYICDEGNIDFTVDY